jgi:hypothetical protein
MDGRYIYTRNFFPHLPVIKYQKYGDVGGIQRAIRRDYRDGKLDDIQAELIRPTRPTEYLFDLEDDTWEVRNLADDEAHRDALERMRSAVFDHIRESRDVMFLPESEMISRAGENAPYSIRQDAAYNPLDRMLEAAVLVGGGAAALPRQMELLDDSSDVVRYWAAVGIYASRDLLEGRIGHLTDHLDDPAPFVRAELAAAVYHASRDPAAKAEVEDCVLSGKMLLAHQAMQKILYMPGVAPDFADSVNELHRRLGDDQSPMSAKFPLGQSVEMYRSLYLGEGLIYPDDAEFASEEEKAPAIPTRE